MYQVSLFLLITVFLPRSFFFIQVRFLGTTTPPSSPVVRWWTSAAMSSSSMSARRLWAVMGWSRTMPSGAPSRKRPMRQLSFSRAARGHKWTPFPTTPRNMRHCQSKKQWRSDCWESEKLLIISITICWLLSIHVGYFISAPSSFATNRKKMEKTGKVDQTIFP